MRKFNYDEITNLLYSYRFFYSFVHFSHRIKIYELVQRYRHIKYMSPQYYQAYYENISSTLMRQS